MSFVLTNDPTFTAPVSIEVPQKGSPLIKKCKGEFKYKDDDWLKAFFDDPNNDDEALLNDVLEGWSGFTDANGDKIEFNEENRLQAGKIGYVRTGFVNAFMKGVQGRTRKN